MIEYIFYFIIYGFIGWLIDSISRSLSDSKLTEASYLGIPFLPSYGFGALVVILLIPILSAYNIVLKFIIYAVLLSSVEYAAGTFVEKTRNEKLWDYRKNRFNVNGRTDLFHAVMWGILALVLEYLIHPFILSLI